MSHATKGGRQPVREEPRMPDLVESAIGDLHDDLKRLGGRLCDAYLDAFGFGTNRMPTAEEMEKKIASMTALQAYHAGKSAKALAFGTSTQLPPYFKELEKTVFRLVYLKGEEEGMHFLELPQPGHDIIEIKARGEGKEIVLYRDNATDYYVLGEKVVEFALSEIPPGQLADKRDRLVLVREVAEENWMAITDTGPNPRSIIRDKEATARLLKRYRQRDPSLPPIRR